MAENKTQPTGASVDEFIDAVDDHRRRDARAVLDLMREVTSERFITPSYYIPGDQEWGAY